MALTITSEKVYNSRTKDGCVEFVIVSPMCYVYQGETKWDSNIIGPCIIKEVAYIPFSTGHPVTPKCNAFFKTTGAPDFLNLFCLGGGALWNITDGGYEYRMATFSYLYDPINAVYVPVPGVQVEAGTVGIYFSADSWPAGGTSKIRVYYKGRV